MLISGVDKMNIDKRPLDVLNKAKDKKVYILLKNGKELRGILQAVDIHINMWIKDTELIDGESQKRMGELLVRGDSVVFVSSLNE